MTRTLSSKEKEMIGVSIAIAVGSESCTSFHVRGAREYGVTDVELSDFVDLALTVRIQATRLIAQVGREQLFGVKKVEEKQLPAQSLLRTLARVGASDGVNCPSALTFHLEEARRLGASDQQLKTTFAIVARIKKIAAGQVKAIGASKTESRKLQVAL